MKKEIEVQLKTKSPQTLELMTKIETLEKQKEENEYDIQLLKRTLEGNMNDQEEEKYDDQQQDTQNQK